MRRTTRTSGTQFVTAALKRATYPESQIPSPTYSIFALHHMIPTPPKKKPIRLFMAVSDRDLLNPNIMCDGMHDWVEANNRMATVLEAKGYQYLFCLDAGHSVSNAKELFLPHAIEWLLAQGKIKKPLP